MLQSIHFSWNSIIIVPMSAPFAKPFFVMLLQHQINLKFHLYLPRESRFCCCVLAVSCAVREMIKAKHHNLHLAAAKTEWTSQKKSQRMEIFLINFQTWSIPKLSRTRKASTTSCGPSTSLCPIPTGSRLFFGNKFHSFSSHSFLLRAFAWGLHPIREERAHCDAKVCARIRDFIT